MRTYRFDLEKAITVWLSGLQEDRVFSADDIAELEQHLRDHVSELMEDGASDQQAFEAAIAEMGGYSQASSEYRKVYFGKLRRCKKILSELGWIASMAANLTHNPSISNDFQAIYAALC